MVRYLHSSKSTKIPFTENLYHVKSKLIGIEFQTIKKFNASFFRQS